LRAFSFVHAADFHLGYSQYGLETRREDFDRAFQELVDRTIELKPDFMIIAGDLFNHARPSNNTLENAITNFSRLREAGIPVLTVDGSHDSAPNVVTGTILNPLDSAGLIYYLPRHEGSPDSELFNIFVLHMALDIPSLTPPYIKAEAPPELIPEGFNYYAAGHVHKPYMDKFKTGMLVYSGSTETVDYKEAKNDKGFYYVEVDEGGVASPQFIGLQCPRKFVVLDEDFTGVTPSKITELVVQLVKGADEEGILMVPVLRGTLPAEASRAEVDVAQLRSAAEKALLVHPVVLLRETEVSEEIVRSIFEAEFKDLKTKAFEYFLQIFSERYTRDEAEKIARVAVSLIEPLTKKEEEKAKRTLEELLK